MSDRIGAIRLSGKDSISFANAFFCPGREQIKTAKNIQKKIDKGICVQETKNGFQATVEDLDLSFLNER